MFKDVFCHILNGINIAWVPEGFLIRSEAAIVSGEAAIEILREREKKPLDAALTNLISMARFILETDHPSRRIICLYGKDYETDYQCVACDSSRVLYLTSFLDGFPRKEDEKCSFRG